MAKLNLPNAILSNEIQYLYCIFTQKYDIITKRGDFLRSKKIVLPETSRVELKANYVELSADSPLNQNDSHFHPECEIYINLSGSVAFEVENHVYPISRGSVIITRPYEYHRCIYRISTVRRHRHNKQAARKSRRRRAF